MKIANLKKISKFFSMMAVTVVASSLMIIPSSTYALSSHGVSTPMSYLAKDSCNESSGCDIIGKYLDPGIDLLTAAFGIISVISIIIGGISYSTSEGDPQKAAKAKARIANTIFAIFAYIFLYAFLQFIIPGGLFSS